MACPCGPAATASWTSSGSGCAAGHQQLEPDQVEPGDRLGHRVLHLQPGVHLRGSTGSPPAGRATNSTVPALT